MKLLAFSALALTVTVTATTTEPVDSEAGTVDSEAGTATGSQDPNAEMIESVKCMVNALKPMCEDSSCLGVIPDLKKSCDQMSESLMLLNGNGRRLQDGLPMDFMNDADELKKICALECPKSIHTAFKALGECKNMEEMASMSKIMNHMCAMNEDGDMCIPVMNELKRANPADGCKKANDLGCCFGTIQAVLNEQAGQGEPVDIKDQCKAVGVDITVGDACETDSGAGTATESVKCMYNAVKPMCEDSSCLGVIPGLKDGCDQMSKALKMPNGNSRRLQSGLPMDFVNDAAELKKICALECPKSIHTAYKALSECEGMEKMASMSKIMNHMCAMNEDGDMCIPVMNELERANPADGCKKANDLGCCVGTIQAILNEQMAGQPEKVDIKDLCKSVGVDITVGDACETLSGAASVTVGMALLAAVANALF